MDPYLESPVYWQDFHATFVPVLREQISDRLPGGYFARIEEEIVLLEPQAVSKRARADVLVGRDPLRTQRETSGATAVAELAPATLHNLEHLDPHTQSYIQILRSPGHEVVTVVEVLSPTNKQGDGRGIYLEKRNRLLQRRINVVELDLLRSGKRIELAEPLPAGHYYALVSRGDRRPECQVYSWTLRQPLPTIPIPLKAPDPDVPADLKQAFGVAFERGRYERMDLYASPPPVDELEAAEVKWASELPSANR